MRETFTRASRSRRVVAIMAWAALVAAAVSLLNSRMSDSIRVISYEPVAFILAAFGAFVGVFAWMLFNPGRQSAAESPTLFLAGAATLFPPAIIAFSLMPPTSSLRVWLTLGIFFLCVIAVLSHVPDEFFGVPRSRKTYFAPMPTFDRMADTVMDPNAAWFSFTDLTQVVSDAERPSLAPSAYLQREETRQGATASASPALLPMSEVDDILGTDLDIDLFDEIPLDEASHEREFYRQTTRDTEGHSVRRKRSVESKPSRDSSHIRPQPRRSRSTIFSQKQRGIASKHQKPEAAPAASYTEHNTDSRRIQQARGVHRDSNTATDNTIRARTRRRMAGSVQVEALQSRQAYRPQLHGSGAISGFAAAASSVANRETAASTPSRAKPSLKTHKFEGSPRTQRQQTSPSTGNTDSAQKERTFVEDDTATEPNQAEIERKSPPTSRTPAKAPEPGDAADSYRRKRKGRKRQTDSTTAETTSTGLATGLTGAVAGTAAYLFGNKRSVKQDDITEQLSAPPPVLAREMSGSLTQPSETSEIQRTTDAYGAELVQGVMTVKFDKGQKRANIHVPFSPPLAGLPDVECECVGGEDLRLKVPVKQSYGIRIEARRSHADEAMEADIGFAVIHTP